MVSRNGLKMVFLEQAGKFSAASTQLTFGFSNLLQKEKRVTARVGGDGAVGSRDGPHAQATVSSRRAREATVKTDVSSVSGWATY